MDSYREEIVGAKNKEAHRKHLLMLIFEKIEILRQGGCFFNSFLKHMDQLNKCNAQTQMQLNILADNPLLCYIYFLCASGDLVLFLKLTLDLLKPSPYPSFQLKIYIYPYCGVLYVQGPSNLFLS